MAVRRCMIQMHYFYELNSHSLGPSAPAITTGPLESFLGEYCFPPVLARSDCPPDRGSLKSMMRKLAGVHSAVG